MLLMDSFTKRRPLLQGEKEIYISEEALIDKECNICYAEKLEERVPPHTHTKKPLFIQYTLP